MRTQGYKDKDIDKEDKGMHTTKTKTYDKNKDIRLTTCDKDKEKA
jgi:hypothetical protein